MLATLERVLYLRSRLLGYKLSIYQSHRPLGIPCLTTHAGTPCLWRMAAYHLEREGQMGGV